VTTAAASPRPGALLLEALGLDLPTSSAGVRVAGLELAVRAGERIHLRGPVDAASAVLRALVGLVRPEAGTVRLLGQDLATLPRRASAHLAGIGWLPRTGALLSNLTLRENLHLPLEFHLGRVDPARVAAALACFGLDEVPDLRPELVPLQVRRRVALARAVLLDPALLLLDDPLDDLEEAASRALAGALAAWAALPHRALVFASPDHDLAAALGARRIDLPVI